MTRTKHALRGDPFLAQHANLFTTHLGPDAKQLARARALTGAHEAAGRMAQRRQMAASAMPTTSPEWLALQSGWDHRTVLHPEFQQKFERAVAPAGGRVVQASDETAAVVYALGRSAARQKLAFTMALPGAVAGALAGGHYGKRFGTAAGIAGAVAGGLAGHSVGGHLGTPTESPFEIARKNSAQFERGQWAAAGLPAPDAAGRTVYAADDADADPEHANIHSSDDFVGAIERLGDPTLREKAPEQLEPRFRSPHWGSRASMEGGDAGTRNYQMGLPFYGGV